MSPPGDANGFHEPWKIAVEMFERNTAALERIGNLTEQLVRAAERSDMERDKAVEAVVGKVTAQMTLQMDAKAREMRNSIFGDARFWLALLIIAGSSLAPHVKELLSIAAH